jgi:signal transduction histidine kinase
MQLIVDGMQMLSALFFCSFIYHALVLHDAKFQKLKNIYYSYIVFTGIYFAVMFIFPDFVRRSFLFFTISRVVVYFIAFFFYYYMLINLKFVFFRYLFLATTCLFISGFMALWDSIANAKTSIYTGFHYLCFGYFFENACFIGAFIYKYFIVDKEKQEVEHRHKVQLFSTKIEMQQQTMDYIGKEIHDNIGQKLTLASLYAQLLEQDSETVESKDKIENISLLINQSLSEMRELSKSLTDNSIEDNIICKLIDEECEQEFFQNSIKHSECKNVSVQLQLNEKNVELILVDDGKGFDITSNYTNGIGLKNMKKRIEMLEGELFIESNINAGTKVTVSLPLK